ncbi:MAG TPA: hypothetical protein VL727_23470 [Puia sp.]|nr:hypothetical protein [Puia sp.]
MTQDQDAAIEQCRALIGRSLGWGDAAYWTNEDFNTLSDFIFDKTNVRLSVSTLKRVWGRVKYDSSPTMATLNALARYAGFEGWRHFLQTPASPTTAPPKPAANTAPQPAPTTPTAPQPNTTAPVPPQQMPPPTPRRKSSTPIVIATIAVVALLSLLSARLIHPDKTTTPLRFEAHSTSDNLPNSVVFDYDATSFGPHSVIIQQSWDPHRREPVDPTGTQHTSIYYFPGYFRAKLIVDGEIKKQTDVFIPSKGWIGIIQREPLPIYLRSGEIKQDSGFMGISKTTLKEKTGSAIFSGLWTGFANVREFPGITGDHFTLEATVRNTSTVEECLCRKVQIMLLGKLNAIVIPLSDKGCISDIGLYFGSGGFGGKDHDLSAFGCDFSQWQQVKCTVADHHFEIRLNDHTIFVKDKVESIGDIVGVQVGFEGTGQIKDLHLQGRGENLNVLMLP